MARVLPRITQFSAAVLIASLLVACVAWFKKGDLPANGHIDNRLFRQPVQTSCSEPSFTFRYRGEDYLIDPVADYEVWGLVVSHNDINAFADIYHTEDSVDIKDLAIIWGSNLKKNDYQRVEFKNESYVVYFRYPAGVDFDHSEISNTHILSDKFDVRRKIGEISVGDQVYLRGLLINYTAKSTGFTRRTSTSRKDTGMGACEVLLVREAMVLKKNPLPWLAIYSRALRSALFSLVLLVIAFIVNVYVDYRRLNP